MAIKYENSEEDGNANVAINVDQPELRKGTHWLRKVSSQTLITGSLLILLTVAIVVVIILLLTHDNTVNSELTQPTDTHKQLSDASFKHPTDPDVNVTLPGKLYISPRREWPARPPNEKAIPLILPVPYVIIMHIATENCSDQATCALHVRQAQIFSMDSRGWDDIGYSFLVGGDGHAYEGRGWKSVGAQVYGYNTKRIGIAFIGTFNQIMPPERQITAAKYLIEIGLKEGYIAKDYKLLAARQLQTTQSPGLLLYEDVKKWPHWSQAP